MIQTDLQAFFRDGCGRCEHYQTPVCKVRVWPDVLAELHAIVRDSPLAASMKWGMPCYTLDGANVAMLAAMKDCCTLSFFKGAALHDPDGLLEPAGPNSHYARLLRFRSVDDVRERREHTVRIIEQAIAAERAGVIVQRPTDAEPMPAELNARLDADPALRDAFDALTPGRKRSFVLYVSGAKQAKTRADRAERCAPKIFAGKGFNER